MLRVTLLLAVAALACHAAPVSDDEVVEQLSRSVIVGDYESAVSQSQELVKDGRGTIVSKTVEKLIEAGQPNIITFASRLWNRGSQDIVKNFFPLQFRAIFSKLPIKLINKQDGMALKLGLKTDSDGDRTAYGDQGSEGIENRAAWKFIPVETTESKVYFKLYNVKENQYLKLGTWADSDGDHGAYASTSSDSDTNQWYLEPSVYDNMLLFIINNRKYQQPLKLGRALDSENDRQAYGHNGIGTGYADLFGWGIVFV